MSRTWDSLVVLAAEAIEAAVDNRHHEYVGQRDEVGVDSERMVERQVDVVAVAQDSDTSRRQKIVEVNQEDFLPSEARDVVVDGVGKHDGS